MTSIAFNGFFDPLQKGHLIMIQEASEVGVLTILLNNDAEAIRKKGYVFMSQEDRKLILENIKGVHKVIVVPFHENNIEAVVRILRDIKCEVFMTGQGDSKELVAACESMGIAVRYFTKRYLPDGTHYSSSKLVERYYDNLKNTLAP